MDEEKLIILNSNIEMRNKEIMEYQINIDNYLRAIAKIDAEHNGDQEMIAFKEVLEKNLKDSLREQMKAKIIRDVMVDQVNQ